MNGPRYRKLTPDLVDEAIEFARAGCANDDIAGLLGIHRASLYNWFSDGRDESARRYAGGDPDPELDLVVDLFDGVRRGRARLNAQMNLRIVEAANNGEYRAANLVLQRSPAYQQASLDSQTAIGAESPDEAADIAHAQITQTQARQVAMAMLELVQRLGDVAETDGADGVRMKGPAIARDCLLSIDTHGDPPALDS